MTGRIYFSDKEHYAKTIIFVISDQHLEGMQAFLASYHGVQQTSECSTSSPLMMEMSDHLRAFPFLRSGRSKPVKLAKRCHLDRPLR